MGLSLLGLMFVNIRADYKAHPFYYPTCLIALSLSFLSAYDIYVPPTSTTDSTNAFGSLDVPAMFERGIQAGGYGSSILRYIRDGTNYARRTAWAANPALCAILALVGWWSEERSVLLVAAAPVWVVCGVLAVARREMRAVGEGVEELKGLRYDYKGA